MKPSQILKEKGWCQGAFARDKDGKATESYSDQATCFCLLGAIDHYAPSDDDAFEYSNCCAKYVNNEFIIAWNDKEGRTKEEVIELCEKVEKELGL